MKNMKFLINNPEQSKQLQQILFKLGHSWMNKKELNYIIQPYIYTNSDLYLTYGNDIDYFHRNPKISQNTNQFILQHSCLHNTINASTQSCNQCGLSIDEI